VIIPLVLKMKYSYILDFIKKDSAIVDIVYALYRCIENLEYVFN